MAQAPGFAYAELMVRIPEENQRNRAPASIGSLFKPPPAFSRVELFFLVAVLAILTAMLLPALSRAKAHSSKINCDNNLKQVGLAFQTWSLDNEDHLPISVSTNRLAVPCSCLAPSPGNRSFRPSAKV